MCYAIFIKSITYLKSTNTLLLVSWFKMKEWIRRIDVYLKNENVLYIDK
jgi:hypothetical protein